MSIDSPVGATTTHIVGTSHAISNIFHSPVIGSLTISPTSRHKLLANNIGKNFRDREMDRAIVQQSKIFRPVYYCHSSGNIVAWNYPCHNILIRP
jgi:hypothetical protein